MLISAPAVASLDLTGLPANPERLDALLLDQSPNAFASYVDELLNACRTPSIGDATGWMSPATPNPVGEKTTSRTPTHGGTEIG